MIRLQQAKGVFNKRMLRDGNMYAEEEVQGTRGFITCTSAGFFINETYLTGPENDLMGVILDGVLEPDGVLTVFDCLKFRGCTEEVKDLPLIRRRRWLQIVLETWNWEKVRMVPNTALLGITIQEMIDRGPTIIKNLRVPYGLDGEWVRVRP